MIIRKAAQSDLDDLVRLNDQIQRQHAEQYPEEFKYPADPEEVRQYFRGLLDDEDITVIVACEAGRPLAYLYCEWRTFRENTFKFARSRCYVHHVLVDEGVRRSGIAAALFEWVANEARNRGILQIALDAWRLNKGAHDFFQRQGFQLTQLLFSKTLD